MPWKRRTSTPGANRRTSASQLPRRLAGQTTSVGPVAPGLDAVQVQGDQGDRLAQAHVVGQAGAEAERGEVGEPGQAVALVVAQVGVQPGRRLDGVAGGGGQQLLAHPEQAGADDDRGVGVGLDLDDAGQRGRDRLRPA